jgi:hypothetical protein
MADPSTLAMASMGGTVAGSLLSAFGSSYKGQAQANMYDYQAGVAKINQQINLQNADYERNVGEVEAQESGMKTRAQVGATVAAQASSGLDVNRGSASDVRTSEIEIGQQDENIIRANAARKAYGYEVEATQDSAQAGLYGMAATTAKTSGAIGALSSILSGGTSVADKWLKGQQTGVFGGSSSSFNFDPGIAGGMTP